MIVLFNGKKIAVLIKI